MKILTNWVGSCRLLLLKRHLKIILRYLTLKKALNLAYAALGFLKRKEFITAKPAYIKIEPSRSCNLSCLGCYHGQKSGIPKNSATNNNLQYSDFKSIIDPISNTLLGISFSYLGEPLLNNSLFEMVRYAHNKNIGTMFPSNLSVKLSEAKIRTLVASGLDLLLVSLDGAKEKTYLKYRKGGDFNLILKNVDKIKAIKKELSSKTPRLVWKYTVFEHNENEVKWAKENYKKIGFDSLSLQYDMYNNKWKEKNKRNKYNKNLINKKSSCFWLWFTMVVEYDGRVTPCCGIDSLDLRHHFNLGNAVEQGIDNIWNNKNYVDLRKSFNKNIPYEKMNPICRKCMLT